MRSAALRTVATVAAGLALAATGATTAAAHQTPTAEPAPVSDGSGDDRGAYPVPMLRALERELGVSTRRAVERLDFQEAAAQVQESLDAELGDDFAGTWLDPQADVVYAASAGQGDDAAVREAGARPVAARYSLEQLDGWAADLGSKLRGVASVPGWYVDVRDNAIVVQTHRDQADAARAAVRAAGVPRGAVTYDVSGERPRLLDDVLGGDPFLAGQGSQCSVGFAVTDGFVTAGHCGEAGTLTSQPSGSFAGSSFPGDDYGYVRTLPGQDLVGAVNNYAGGQVPVAGAEPAPVGTQVCRSGATTGWHCGTVTARDATVAYPEGTVSGLIRTTVCAEPGDSGGSLVAGRQAQGVTSGGSGDCSAGGTTYFQPVREILRAYDLTLATASTGS